MKLSDLEKQYPNGELNSPHGFPEIKCQVFTPVFRSLIGKKAIYHERFRRIIRIEDVKIFDDRFQATAVFLTLINSPRHYVQIDKWTFGSAWFCLHISDNRLVPYSIWQLWIDDDIVQNVEELCAEGKLDEAFAFCDLH